MARHLSLIPTADPRPRLVMVAPCCPVTGAPCPHALTLPVRVGEIIAAARTTAHRPATRRETREAATLARVLAGTDARTANTTEPGALAA